MGNKLIKFVESFSHPGRLITSNSDDSADIMNRRSNFISQGNNVLCYFGKYDSFVKYRLFQSYCTSFYGCELWQLNLTSICSVCAT